MREEHCSLSNNIHVKIHLSFRVDDLRVFFASALQVASVDSSLVGLVVNSSVCLLLRLGYLLDLSFFVNLCLSLLEVFSDIVMSGDWPIVPRVCLDLLEGESVSVIILEHEGNETLELLAEVGLSSSLVGAMASPEYVRSVHEDLVVELVLLGISSVEGWVACDHDEENNCRGKEIYLSTIVSVIVVVVLDEYLWSHVSKSSQDGSLEVTSVSACQWSSKPEVSYLQIEVAIIE